MKNRFFASLLLGAVALSSFEQPIKIVRTTTDAEVKAAEQEVLRRYKNKVVVTVSKRNAAQEITHIHAQRFSLDGQKGGSCYSDNFGEMVIGPTSFSIKDYGVK